MLSCDGEGLGGTALFSDGVDVFDAWPCALQSALVNLLNNRPSKEFMLGHCHVCSAHLRVWVRTNGDTAVCMVIHAWDVASLRL